MMKVFVRSITVLLMLTQQPVRSQEYMSSFDMRVLYKPEWISIDGKPTLYYELYITNLGSDTFRLVKLDVLDATDSTILMTAGKNKQALIPGATTLLYIELTSEKPVKQVLHRITFNSKENLHSAIGAATGPLQSSRLVVGPPLGNGAWVAIYDPAWERGHRRVVYTVNGMDRIPGRFAIDLIKVDEQGRYAHDDEDQVKNWYGYGARILAVADGVVLAVKNDFKESASVSKHIQPGAEQATGNYISLDIGNGHYVFYEHLQPGSITVQPGQKVKKGEAIASLGFTGQSTGPHLHFHIADKNSPLGAEGIPFAFEQFSILGRYNNLDKFGKERWIPDERSNVTNERPGPNTVIQFKP